ncbi:MAG: hypothetical protein R6X19_09410 [Kiritimatiellia bacterium]
MSLEDARKKHGYVIRQHLEAEGWVWRKPTAVDLDMVYSDAQKFAGIAGFKKALVDPRARELFRELLFRLADYYLKTPGGASYPSDLDFRLGFLILHYARFEHLPLFDEDDRLILTNPLLSRSRAVQEYAMKCWPMKAGNRTRHNHPTFKAVTLLYAADYFSRFNLPCSKDWLAYTGSVSDCDLLKRSKQSENSRSYEPFVFEHAAYALFTGRGLGGLLATRKDGLFRWYAAECFSRKPACLFVDRVKVLESGLENAHVGRNALGRVGAWENGSRLEQKGVFRDLTSDLGWCVEKKTAAQSANWKHVLEEGGYPFAPFPLAKLVFHMPGVGVGQNHCLGTRLAATRGEARFTISQPESGLIPYRGASRRSPRGEDRRSGSGFPHRWRPMRRAICHHRLVKPTQLLPGSKGAPR